MRFGNGIIDHVFDSSDQVPNSIIENEGWVSSSITSETPDKFVFSGVYALTGSSVTLPI
jgi:hypothetical protein